MKTTQIIALLLICAAPAFGEVTPAQMEQYLKDPPYSWLKEQAEVYALVRAATSDLSLRTPAKKLAARWHIPEDAASNLIHALVIKADRQMAHEGFIEHLDAVEMLAPESDNVWNIVVRFRIEESGCSDALRAKYLDQSSGARTTTLLEQCGNWVPEFYRHHPDDIPARFMLVDAVESDDLPAALAVSRSLLDTLESSTPPARADVRDAALMRYWALLGRAGLGTVLLTDADARPRDQLLAMLDAEITPVMLDEFQIGGDGRDEDRRDRARTAWLLALVDAGRLEQARRLDAKFGWRLTHDILRGTPEPQRDLFDDYAGNGESGGLLDEARYHGPMAMRLTAKFLAANQFDSGGRSLLRQLCVVRHPFSVMPSPEKLSAAYRAQLQRYSSLIATRRTADGCAPAATDGAIVSSRLQRLPETPLTEQEKVLPPRATLTEELSLPKHFQMVRAERDGNRVTAICISKAADPGISWFQGGYWLMQSKNGGRTWQTPLYLGFQKFEPYVVLPQGRLPMLRGNNLRLEVDVEELDPESITFPPMRLRSRRQARDLYITVPLSALRRDSDHDGYTDILEARLNTDPRNRDTDGDGLSDRRDDFPHVSARGKPHALAPIIFDMLDRLAEDEETDQQEDCVEDDPPRLDCLRSNPDSFRFTFIEGDQEMFRGLHFDRHVIVLSDAQVRESAARFGPTLPLTFPDILLAPDGKRALVRWNAGWAGGAYRYDKVDGEWVGEEVDNWITRSAGDSAIRLTQANP